MKDFQIFLSAVIIGGGIIGLSWLMYNAGYAWGEIDAQTAARFEARCVAASGVIVNGVCFDKSIIKATE